MTNRIQFGRHTNLNKMLERVLRAITLQKTDHTYKLLYLSTGEGYS